MSVPLAQVLQASRWGARKPLRPSSGAVRSWLPSFGEYLTLLAAGYADQPRLPQTDLVYAAFRICYFDLFTELDMADALGSSDLDDGPYGYLTLVPYFQGVPAAVQLELLAEVWAKHYAPHVQQATLLDAAVLWAVFSDAGRIGLEVWGGDLAAVLSEGPRKVRLAMNKPLAQHCRDTFNDFWDDVDFLMLDESLDLSPEAARELRRILDIPEDWVEEMLAVLKRARASETILGNLKGLLTDQEIADHRELLLEIPT